VLYVKLYVAEPGAQTSEVVAEGKKFNINSEATIEKSVEFNA